MAIAQVKRKLKETYYGLRYSANMLLTEKLPSEEYAHEFLNQYQPDPGTSVFCENRIHDPRWDLTIVVPIYNVEQHLEECLESVLTQKTQFTYHVIAVNDGSTDNSAEILRRFSANERLTILNQKNKGLSGARNAAIRDIYSKYIMFVDSDDILMEEAVELLMKEAYASDADIVQGSFVSFQHGTGKLLSKTVFPRSRTAGDGSNIGGTAWAKVYKANLWEHTCFPEKYWYEDTVVTSIHAYLARRISTLDKMVYRYRIRTGSITAISAQKRKALDTFWITQGMLSARKQLALACDAEYYAYLLRQAVMNYKRTAKQPKQVQQSIFVLTRKMLREQRPHNYVPSEKQYAILENAILNGTYNEYRYRCSIWK